jgi:hypothetical protein
MKIFIFLLLIEVTFSQVSIRDSLIHYEKQFNPELYDIKSLVLPRDLIKVEEPELTTGYRVQVFVTTQLDTANRIKNLLIPIVEPQRVYIVYEPPNYKIRVGDFLNLREASYFREFLERNGFKDAWIVVDKVYRR